MKPSLLISSLAIAAASALAAPNEPSAPATPAPSTKSAATVSSHVTVTIDSGGKKVTHEMDLGSNPTITMQAPHKVKIESNGGEVQVTGKPEPWLGVAPDEVSEELRAQLPLEEGTGLILRSVTPDSPAAKAGLRKNDVLVKFDDQILTNARQLSALVHLKKDGEKARLTYFREGKSSAIEAQIGTHAGGESSEDPFNLSHLLNSVITGAIDTTSPLRLESNMVIMDKDGHVLVTKTQPDLSAVTTRIEKILRAAGVDEKTINETEKTIIDAAKTASSVASSIGSADGDVASQLKNTADQVAKSLEKARAAAEHARKQAEDVRGHLEDQRERLEKQRDPQKSPAVQ
jgi:membrane-associated protease RseP (regulator of RpoE activity)